jgi:hypothetical protein
MPYRSGQARRSAGLQQGQVYGRPEPNQALGALPSSYVAAESISERPVNTGIETPLKPDRGWRIVTGPPLTPRQLHRDTIPDDPGGWEGGEYRLLEAEETAAIKAAGSRPTASLTLTGAKSPALTVSDAS